MSDRMWKCKEDGGVCGLGGYCATCPHRTLEKIAGIKDATPRKPMNQEWTSVLARWKCSHELKTVISPETKHGDNGLPDCPFCKISELQHTIELQKKTFDDEVELLQQERDKVCSQREAYQRGYKAGAKRQMEKDALIADILERPRVPDITPFIARAIREQEITDEDADR